MLVSLEKYRKTKSAVNDGIPIYGFTISEIKKLGFMNPYVFYGGSLLNSRIFYAFLFVLSWWIREDFEDSFDIFGTSLSEIDDEYSIKTMLFISLVALISSGVISALIFFWRVYFVYPNGISRYGVNSEMKGKIRYAFLYFQGTLIYEESLKVIKIILWMLAVDIGFGIIFIILSETSSSHSLFSFGETMYIIVRYCFIIYLFIKILNIIRIDKVIIPKRIAREVLGYGKVIKIRSNEYLKVREGNPNWFKFYFLDNIIIALLISLTLMFSNFNDSNSFEDEIEYEYPSSINDF